MRRRAFSVPQDAQREYIVRANQFVMRALATSIPTITSKLKSASFNFRCFHEGSAGSVARDRSRA